MIAALILTSGVAFQAIVTAVLGLSMNVADSLLLVAVAAFGCVLAAVATRTTHPGAAGTTKATLRLLAWLNVWTAAAYLTFFVGLGIKSASVVFMLEATSAPLAVTAWSAIESRLYAREAAPRSSQWWAAGALAALGVLVVTAMVLASGDEIGPLLAASALGMLSGAAAGATVIVCRRLGNAQVSVRHVMAHRFYLVFAVAVAALVILLPTGHLAPPTISLPMLALTAVASMVLPLFAVQFAVQRLAPAVTTAVFAMLPAVTLIVERAAGNAVTWPVLLVAALILPVSLAVMMSQRPRAVTAPQPCAPAGDKSLALAN